MPEKSKNRYFLHQKMLFIIIITVFFALVSFQFWKQSTLPLSSFEQTILDIKWHLQIRLAVGFWHEDLDNLLKKSLIFQRDPKIRNYDFTTVIKRIFYNNAEYIAVLISPFDGYMGQFGLFRYADGKIDLLHYNETEYASFWNIDFETEPSDLGGFADRNQNGYPDLLIRKYAMGSRGYAPFTLLEIQATGDIVNLLPATTDLEARDILDMDNDGILDFVYYETYTDNGWDYIAIKGIYSWNGTQYSQAIMQDGIKYFTTNLK